MTGYGGADRAFFWSGIPPYTERAISTEFEGGALVNKALSNLAGPLDTLDANITAGMPYGRNRGEPGRPVLDFPAGYLRIAGSNVPGSRAAEKKLFDELKKTLPDDVREDLEESLKQSPNQREAVFVALEKTLSYIAIGLLRLENLPENAPVTSQKSVEEAISALLLQGERIVKEGFAQLQIMGRNHRHFDTLLHFLKQLANMCKLLQRNSDEEEEKNKEKSDNEEDSSEGKKDKSAAYLKKIASYIESIQKLYDKNREVSDLRIVGAFFQGINHLNNIQLLPPALRGFFHGLVLSDIGNDRTISSTATCGSETKKFLTGYSDLIVNTLSDPNPGERQFYRLFMENCCLFSLFSGLSLLQNNLSATNRDKDVTNLFVLQNAVILTSSFDHFTPFIDAKKIKVPFSASDISAAIEFLPLTLLIKVLSRRHNRDIADFFEGTADVLLKRFECVEKIFRIAKETGNAVSDLSLINLADCRRSLEANDYDHYISSFNKFLESFGCNSNLFDQELEEFYAISSTFKSSFLPDSSELNNSLNEIVRI